MTQETNSQAYEKFAGLCALLVGLSGIGYAVAFIVLLLGGVAPGPGALLSSLFLLLGGLLTPAVLAALYHHLKHVDAGFSLLGLLLSAVGAVGAAIHGGYDLANALHPPAVLAGDLPNPVDPRGLLTFLSAGLGLLVIAWLMARSPRFPKGPAVLGGVSALLMVILYLGRLVVLNPKSPAILAPALLNGFLVNPAWYVWVGASLWPKRKP
ncbi:MAG: hypothetical protein FJ316_00490 [SAR202 cluster bacterium]|nr:hypothetical protein [SAR202 cluster bacterium]